MNRSKSSPFSMCIVGIAGVTALLVCGLVLCSCESGGGGGLGDGHDFGENNPDLYVAMGDSITAGYGLTNYYECYPVRLSSMLERTVINEGRSGETSAEGMSRVNRVLSAYKPGYILILYGANDLIHQWSQTYTIANLRGMIQAAKSNKTIPVIATLTPVCGGHSFISNGVVQLSQRIRALAAEEDVTVVDLEEELDWNITYLQEDGLHPNSLGQEQIAAGFNDVF